MSPAEIEELVEQVGDEILDRLGLPSPAPASSPAPTRASASAWPRPAEGYASALELVCASPRQSADDVAAACRRAADAGAPVVWAPVSRAAVCGAALAGAPTSAGALIDHPFGAASTPARLADIEVALRLGVDLVNLTLNSGNLAAIEGEIHAAAALCSSAHCALAVTLDSSTLSEEQLAGAAVAAVGAGADAVCCASGALSDDYSSATCLAALHAALGGRAALVAGGRIAGFPHAAALIAAGADRIALADPWSLLQAAPAG